MTKVYKVKLYYEATVVAESKEEAEEKVLDGFL